MKAVIAILFALAFFPISSISAEENFPFIAKVNAENVERYDDLWMGLVPTEPVLDLTNNNLIP